MHGSTLFVDDGTQVCGRTDTHDEATSGCAPAISPAKVRTYATIAKRQEPLSRPVMLAQGDGVGTGFG